MLLPGRRGPSPEARKGGALAGLGLPLATAVLSGVGPPGSRCPPTQGSRSTETSQEGGPGLAGPAV